MNTDQRYERKECVEEPNNEWGIYLIPQSYWVCILGASLGSGEFRILDEQRLGEKRVACYSSKYEAEKVIQSWSNIYSYGGSSFPTHNYQAKRFPK